jgi:hypothetical protein
MNLGQPFTAFDTIALRAALGALDGDECRTFLGLCTYADPRGVCFPGARRLAEVTGLPLATIFNTLDRLEVKGLFVYLQRNQIDPLTKRHLPNVFAMNPALLNITDQALGVVLPSISALEQMTRIGFSPHDSLIQNPESVTSYSNQLQNHHHQPATESKPSAYGAVHDPSNEGGDSGADYANKGENRKTRDAPKPESMSPQGDKSKVSGGREPVSLRGFRSALESDVCEQLALDLAKLAGDLSLPNARMLVDVYGAWTIRQSMSIYHARGDTPIYSPARWFRKVVRRLDSEEEAG